MRLQAGGEVSPDNARHMGLFVVGRIAARHGIRVGLRGPAANEAGSGTTAEIYLPPTILEGAAQPAAPRARIRAVSSPSVQRAAAIAAPDVAQERKPEPAIRNAPPITLLPRRNPGSSGITEVPAQPGEPRPQRGRRELPTPWWESGTPAQPQPDPKPEPEPKPTPARAASDTSAFFAARSREADRPATPAPAAPAASIPAAPNSATAPADDDVIYRRMLSEMLGDPHDLVNHPDLDWQSVWDRGWTLAAAAEDKPVESRTAEHGLPVRTPGARLVPGAPKPTGAPEQDQPAEEGQAANGGFHSDREPQHAAVARDPEAVRASFSSHFGGVRTGRSHARDTSQGSDQE
jgi:hypothetical protein